MDWRLLFIGYIILTVGTYLLRRYMAQKFDSRARFINTLFLLALFPAGIVIAVISHANLDIGWLNLLFVLIGSAVFPIALLLLFRANKEVDAGHMAILSNLGPIITIALGVLVLNEMITFQQAIGTVVIVFSALLASASQLKKRSLVASRGILFAVLAAGLVGVGTVFELVMLQRMDFGAYLFYGWGAQMLWMLAIGWKQLRHVKQLRNRTFAIPVITYVAANVVKAVLFLGALFAVNSASTIGASLGLIPVLVVIAAYFFLKERQHVIQRLVAGVLGIIGLVIIYAI